MPGVALPYLLVAWVVAIGWSTQQFVVTSLRVEGRVQVALNLAVFPSLLGTPYMIDSIVRQLLFVATASPQGWPFESPTIVVGLVGVLVGPIAFLASFFVALPWLATRTVNLTRVLLLATWAASSLATLLGASAV